MRLLVAEDELYLAEALEEILKNNKYSVDVVHDGEAALDYALSGIYDAIILDVMMPKMDGFAVVRALRDKAMQTPVLMLTARAGVADKVQGLDSGADDYLTKPFSAEELLARLRALIRRPTQIVSNELALGDIILNLDAYTLQCDTRSVRLSLKEFEIMRLLLSNPTAVVPKEDMLLKIWGSESDAEDNNVEVYISFLRKKLFYLSSTVTITTVRRVGYYLEVAQ